MEHCPPAGLADWIAEQHQRPAADGSECRSEVAAGIQCLARRLAFEACGQVSATRGCELAPYVERLWTCLEHHWRKFATAGRLAYAEVVRRLEAGELEYGRVTANVLWEVTLAQALELRENRAAERFEVDYMPTVRAIAGSVGGPAAVDAVDNLAAELILPRGTKPARIATFHGKTPLANWLRAVVANYWISQTRARRPQTGQDLPDVAVSADPAERLDEQRCKGLLRPILVRAVSAIPAEDRLLLKMLVLDGVPQHRLARSFRINSGTLTRRRQHAALGILAHVQQIAAQSPCARPILDCLEMIAVSEDTQLRARLAEILAQGVRADPPNREDRR